jgi:hypothetical protein
MANCSPQKQRESNRLPHEVRRKDQKPCHPVAASDFAVQGIEESSESGTGMFSENLVADKKYSDREQDQANKKQAKKKRQFVANSFSKGVLSVAHSADTVAESDAIVAYGGGKIKRWLVPWIPGFDPASIDHDSHMQAGGSKKQVMRLDPEPVSYVDCRQQRRDSGEDVKIGKGRVQQFGDPYFPR